MDLNLQPVSLTTYLLEQCNIKVNTIRNLFISQKELRNLAII